MDTKSDPQEFPESQEPRPELNERDHRQGRAQTSKGHGSWEDLIRMKVVYPPVPFKVRLVPPEERAAEVKKRYGREFDEPVENGGPTFGEAFQCLGGYEPPMPGEIFGNAPLFLLQQWCIQMVCPPGRRSAIEDGMEELFDWALEQVDHYGFHPNLAFSSGGSPKGGSRLVLVTDSFTRLQDAFRLFIEGEGPLQAHGLLEFLDVYRYMHCLEKIGRKANDLTALIRYAERQVKILAVELAQKTHLGPGQRRELLELCRKQAQVEEYKMKSGEWGDPEDHADEIRLLRRLESLLASVEASGGES